MNKIFDLTKLAYTIAVLFCIAHTIYNVFVFQKKVAVLKTPLFGSGTSELKNNKIFVLSQIQSFYAKNYFKNISR